MKSIRPLIGVILSYFIFWFAIQSGIDRNDIQGSFLFVVFAGFFAIFFLGYYLRESYNGFYLIVTLSGFFVLKMGIGTVHYLSLIQPEYFESSGTPEYLPDFLWIHNFAKYLAEYRISNGYFTFPDLQYLSLLQFGKSHLIALFISDVYYFTGPNALNFSVINTLTSIYSSVLIAAMVNEMGYPLKQVKTVLILCLVQGFAIIPSVLERDIVGQFFLVIGLFLLFYFRKRKLLQLLFLPIVLFLFYSLRTTYVIIPLIVLLYNFLLELPPKYKQFKYYIVIAAIPAIIFILSTANFLDQVNAYSTGKEGGFKNAANLTYYVLLPINIFRAFLGPFPWVQFLEYKSYTLYHPMDYWQAILNIALVSFAFKVAVKKYRELDMVSLTGIILLLISLFSGLFNMTYIAVGIIFIYPLVAHITARQWAKRIGNIFVAYIFFNLLFIALGLYGQGTADLFKLN